MDGSSVPPPRKLHLVRHPPGDELRRVLDRARPIHLFQAYAIVMLESEDVDRGRPRATVRIRAELLGLRPSIRPAAPPLQLLPTQQSWATPPQAGAELAAPLLLLVLLLALVVEKPLELLLPLELELPTQVPEPG